MTANAPVADIRDGAHHRSSTKKACFPAPAKALDISLCKTFASCAAKSDWQSDAMVLFADEGVLLSGKYVRAEGSRVIEGELLKDLRTCGVTQFEVFDLFRGV